MTKKLYPNLRFIEFNEDWRNYSLSEVADFFNEKRIPIEAEKRISGKYPYYGATGIIDYVDDYIFEGEYILLAEDGANIITRTSPITYVTKDKFWVNNHAHVLRSKSGTNIFLSHVLENQNYIQYNSGTAQPKLNSQIVKKINLSLPTYEEQVKIGTFLEKINKIIILYQQELDALKQTKQGFLQKMFPKEGENVPKIRFEGFSEEWESKTFSLLVNRTSKQSNSDILPKLEFEDIISGEGKLNKDISNKFDNRKGILFEPGYILFGKLRPYLKNWLLPDFKGIALGDFWVFTTDYYAEFIYSLIQTSKFQTAANLSSGTKMPRSDWKTVSSTEFLIPSIQEQVKIGEFFRQLDEVVDLKEQELEALKQTKQGFLQKMFV